MTLGEKIYQLRKDKHMTQEQLAQLCEVSRQSVGKWETDSVVPDINNIVLLCQIFEVSSDYLLLDKETIVEKKRFQKSILIFCIAGFLCLLMTLKITLITGESYIVHGKLIYIPKSSLFLFLSALCFVVSGILFIKRANK